jgi:hypothetical protein
MPLQATSGAASYDAFGGGAAAVPNYIEDVFSTYLYDGGFTGAIVNNIDLSTKGGLVWLKFRSGSASETNHELFDTVRGTGKFLVTNSNAAQVTDASSLNSFNTNGFNIQTDPGMDAAGSIYASWTFRKQAKFFDVLTYTGNGTSSKTISHSLGSTPGCIIVKKTGTTSGWYFYHRSLAANNSMELQASDPAGLTNNFSGVTSTSFNVTSATDTNENNQAYIAYLWAHDAGGFGLSGADNVITCGSYTGNGSATGPTVDLGYEPQWVMTKRATVSTGNWIIFDNMRGLSMTDAARLLPNGGNAESSSTFIAPTSTGFKVTSTDQDINISGSTYIYIAIRRGPMKVPTDATTVFAPNASAGTGSTRTITTNFPVDFQLANSRAGASWPVRDRLRGGGVGATKQLTTTTTDAETTTSSSFGISFDNNTGIGLYQTTSNGSGINYIYYHFRRAPSFFDEVCWTGNDAAPRNINHNLTVVPEMMIVKGRSNAGTSWIVYHKNLPSALYYLVLESTAAQATGSNVWRSTAPTASVFTVGNDSWVNTSGDTFVNYLFATCAGVSKVGSYTGNGSSQTINCGFTGGARFVLIKKSSGTGDWMVSDSARGIVSGNDPYLELNNTNAEVTGEDWLDTDSTGFVVNEVSGSNANTNGATYIFLAIA